MQAVIVTEAPSVPTRPTALLGTRDRVCAGIAKLSGNWISEGVQPFETLPGSELKLEAVLHGFDAAMRGKDPMFIDIARLHLHPSATSAFKSKGAILNLPAGHSVDRQYAMHGYEEPRPNEAPPTPGAFAPK